MIYFNFKLLALIIGSFLLGVVFSLVLQLSIPYFMPSVNSMTYNENCSGMDLFDTSKCLNQELKTFFFYNITQTGKDLSLDQLKKEGGVCIHSADYYLNRGKELGFYATKITFPIKDRYDHAITIISNSSGYCLEDISNIYCVTFIQDINKMEVK